MAKSTGIFQLDNGNYGFRFVIQRDGKTKNVRRTKDEAGRPYKTKKAAERARRQTIIKTAAEMQRQYVRIERRTLGEVYREYCDSGRAGKAYSTIRKQDSLWNNHIKAKFARRYVDEITAAEINDYLADLYYNEGRAFGYVESFLKVFYLLLGQAYSRNYLSVDAYNKLCTDKNTRIHMPKRKIDDDDEIIVFTPEEIAALDEYFKGTTLETAYMLGRYCGLRINEAFGVKWSDIDTQRHTITICRQMQYQKGVIKLVPVKTKNGRRTVMMSDALCEYFENLQRIIEAAKSERAEMRAQQQKQIQDTDGAFISSLDLVNTLPGGQMRTVNSFKRHTRKIRDELHIDFKFHYLRHTYGTRLAEMNTPAHILCQQMGHASSRVTERYYLTTSKSGEQILRDNLNRI